MLPKSWRRNGWSEWHAVAAMVMVALGITATAPAWQDIVERCLYSGEFAHMLLAPIAAVCLVYARRLRLRRCRQEHLWVGVAIAAAGWLIYLAGQWRGWDLAWHSGALLVVLGCFLTVAGGGVLREFLPAFVVMCFVIPVPDIARRAVIDRLQDMSAQAAQWLFAPFGMTLSRSGDLLFLDGHEVAIGELRNTSRLVFALFTLAFAIAFAMPLRTYARVIIMLAAPLCAVVCSVASMIPTVWLYAAYPGVWTSRCCRAVEWLMLCLASLLLLMVPRLLRGALLPVMRHSVARE